MTMPNIRMSVALGISVYGLLTFEVAMATVLTPDIVNTTISMD
jgi:hypothetical protein